MPSLSPAAPSINFEFFGPLPTFLLMVLITTTAFLLAVRLECHGRGHPRHVGRFSHARSCFPPARIIPLGLFGYIAILDAGLIVVALNRRWDFLTALAAAGTAFMQIGWAGKFFEPGKYFEGDKILVALAVLLGFNVLYLAAAVGRKTRGSANKWLSGSTLGLVAVALVFTAWFLSFAPLAQRPWLMFGFVFLIDLIVAALVLLDDEIAPAQPIAGLAVFGLLAAWTAHSLTNDLLNAALGVLFHLRRRSLGLPRVAATPARHHHDVVGQPDFSAAGAGAGAHPHFPSSRKFRSSSGRSCCWWTCWPSAWPW